MVGDTAPKRWRLAVDGLAVLTAVALLLSGWALYSRFSQATQARNENKATWHAVICVIEQATLKTKLSAVRKDQILLFYDDLLVNNVHTAPCGLRTT